MKVLYCTHCGDIRAPDPTGTTWVFCRCGNMAVQWGAAAGKLRVRAIRREFARVIGLNNSMLYASIEDHHGHGPEYWRQQHEEATNAHGFIFDKAFRACWACILTVGATDDITWEPEAE